MLPATRSAARSRSYRGRSRGSESTIDKAERRTRARSLPPATARESRAVVDRLVGLDAVTTATCACLYLPMDHEVDLQALPGHLPEVRWVTTRTGDGPRLTLHDLDAAREHHPWGYDQPVATAPEVHPATVDLWLVPGLAFDLDGTRLGHGRGFYDRLLAHRRDDCVLVGVTTSRRLVAALPREDHDVAMDVVVTDEQVRRTSAD